MPRSLPTSAKVSIARSMSSLEWVADGMARIRALPRATMGNFIAVA